MKVSYIAKRMIGAIALINVAAILMSILYYRSLDFLPFLLGIILGAAVSILKVFLLERAVDKALEMDKKKAGNYVSFQHIFRLLISGVVIFIGAVVPQISLWGVAVGILSFQAAVYNVRFTPNK